MPAVAPLARAPASGARSRIVSGRSLDDPGGTLPCSTARCSVPTLSGVHSTAPGLWNPRRGSLLDSGVWPPSKPSEGVAPERAFWPLCPRVEVLPRPEPIPRPTRLACACVCVCVCLGVEREREGEREGQEGERERG